MKEYVNFSVKFKTIVFNLMLLGFLVGNSKMFCVEDKVEFQVADEKFDDEVLILSSNGDDTNAIEQKNPEEDKEENNNNNDAVLKKKTKRRKIFLLSLKGIGVLGLAFAVYGLGIVTGRRVSYGLINDMQNRLATAYEMKNALKNDIQKELSAAQMIIDNLAKDNYLCKRDLFFKDIRNVFNKIRETLDNAEAGG